ncbi:thioesterase II family protein [Wukongibacter sp. M2B1]|uniref:thioesterase II family protein n=1 Tax=Wukongibacter sp. M2B1 TaxID=3088895 RepID=UPI003D7B5D6A
MKKEEKRWLVYRKENPNMKVRLFCLPYAGASASYYVKWQRYISDWIEICPIQLPGREARQDEEFITNMSQLISEIIEDIKPFLDSPFAIFGHSLGGIIGFELASALIHKHGINPIHLFVSGSIPPRLAADREAIHNLPDEEFKEKLSKYNGTNLTVLDSYEFDKYFMPILRNDFKLFEDYRYSSNEELRCPIKAYVGKVDLLVTEKQTRLWNEYTLSDFDYEVLEGDHFYINRYWKFLCDDICNEIEKKGRVFSEKYNRTIG